MTPEKLQETLDGLKWSDVIRACASLGEGGKPVGFRNPKAWQLSIGGKLFAVRQVVARAARINQGVKFTPAVFDGPAMTMCRDHFKKMGFEFVQVRPFTVSP